jgi:protein-histidine pros-kinase
VDALESGRCRQQIRSENGVVGQVAESVDGQRGPRILVVEDDQDVQRLMVRALAPEYQIEAAADGAVGLEKAVALAPDLIVTDLKLPGLSGGELVRRVRTHPDLDTTSILVLSGLEETGVRIQLLSEGAQDYIAKPFAVGELRARVRNLIAAQRARAVLVDRGAAREAAIFEVALDGIISVDHRGRVTEFNPAAETIFGCPRADAIGRPLADLINPASMGERQQAGLPRYLAPGEGSVVGTRVEMTGTRRDGMEFPLELSICRIPASDPPVFTGFLRDLTETKRAAEALRSAEARLATAEANWKAEQRFRRLLESAPDAVIIVDTRAVIIEANAQTEKLFGYARGDLLGRDVQSLVPARLREKHLAARAAYFREPSSLPMGSGGELYGLRGDGTEVPIEISLSPIEVDEGLVFVAAMRDVSDRRRAEKIEHDLVREQAARIAAEEAVRSRDDFVAVAGHELKTPLAAMLLQIQILRRTVHNGKPINIGERIDKIARSGVRLERLVEQLLDVSRIAAGRLRLEKAPCDLAEVARDVADRFADASAQASCDLSVRVDEHAEGLWDRLRLEGVVANLLSNAIKFGSGEPIEIVVGNDRGQAVLRVRDHGIGIGPEDRDKLFRRFERTIAARDYGGFGLGLWICRNIVEASGGTIEVASEPHRGSTFTVRLPLGREEGTHAAP